MESFDWNNILTTFCPYTYFYQIKADDRGRYKT